MKKILIVEDEPHYREYIKLALEQSDYILLTAESGLEAIRTGVLERPDLIISDWMLQSNVNGLEVFEVLREVLPHLQIILITGFPSVDIKSDAFEQRVARFISKPFELSQIRTAVSEVLSADFVPWQPVLAFAEVEDTWKVVHANSYMQKLLLPAGSTSIDMLSEQIKKYMGSSKEQDWDSYLIDESKRIHFKTVVCGGRHFLLALEEDNYPLRRSKAVLLLLYALGQREALTRWQQDGRVLIVDDEEFFRRMVASQFEEAGAFCHTAENYQLALSTLRRDPGIRYIVLDYDMPDINSYPSGISGIIEDFREINSEVVIVGSSGHQVMEEFIIAGADTFLEKPWFFDDFTACIQKCRRGASN